MRKWPRATCPGKPKPVIDRPFEDLPKETRKSAKAYWRVHKYKFRELDDELRTFLECPLPYDPPLRGARKALGLTVKEVAAKLGCSPSAYAALELRDVKGTATLQAMRKAAHAMECEIVIAVRPKGRRLYSDVVWERLAPRALNNKLLWALNGDRQARFLAFLVGEL